MKKALVLSTVLMSTVLFYTSAFAAAWKVPTTNVRIVQLSNTDTAGGIYGSIQAAINSITDASATNPYVVKVMPGVYDLGTASLQMKDYVDLEGSGQDNTIIKSSNNGITHEDCTVGTVLMANNSSITNIKVVNNPPVLNSAVVNVSALIFNNVKARAEGIKVVSGSLTTDGGENNGISVCGIDSDARLNNVTVETYNSGVRSNPIHLFESGKMTLTNSRLSGIAQGDVYGISSVDAQSWLPGQITISNSTIDVNGGSMSHGISARNYKTSISNSTINLNTGSYGAESFYITSYQYLENFTIANTRVISKVPVQYYAEDPSVVKIFNSELPGDLSSLAGAKLTNNIDENGNPIPNQ